MISITKASLIVIGILLVGLILSPTTDSFQIKAPSHTEIHIQQDHSSNKVILNINQNFQVARGSGDSMSPSLNSESQLIEINATKDNLGVGDLVDYKCNGLDIVHRIVNIDGDYYITKGDNNKDSDDLAFGCKPTINEIDGKVVGVIY